MRNSFKNSPRSGRAKPAEHASDHAPAALRRIVAARAHEICEYCCTPSAFATQSFALDHILPRTAGGATTLENLAWACFGCNAHKHTQTQSIDPETHERVKLFNPRAEKWSDHLAWNEDFTLIVGKTAPSFRSAKIMDGKEKTFQVAPPKGGDETWKVFSIHRS